MDVLKYRPAHIYEAFEIELNIVLDLDAALAPCTLPIAISRVLLIGNPHASSSAFSFSALRGHFFHLRNILVVRFYASIDHIAFLALDVVS